MPVFDDPILLSRAEVAAHAGVSRAAVSNWESRHESFPRAIQMGSGEAFDATAVAAWLEGRVIPSNGLQGGEPVGTDYGSRFVRSLNLGSLAAPQGGETLRDEPVTPVESPGAQAARWLVDQFKGSDFPATAIRLAFVVYLRERHKDAWASLQLWRGWEAFEDAWLRIEDQEPAFQDMPRPAPPPAGSVATDLWDTDRVMRLVDEACSRVRTTPGLGDRPPAVDLLRHLAETYVATAGPKSAEHSTPRAVVRLVVDSLMGSSPPSPRIYDPYCRTGEFLDEAASRLRQGETGAAQVKGHSPDRNQRLLAQMSLLLHGVDSRIDGTHGLETVPEQGFDFILTNPPFNLRLPEEVTHRHSWRYGPPPVNNANYGWLQHISAQLNLGGRAAVIMPNNAGLTRSVREHEIRKGMLEDGVVECVIGLPPNLFADTAIPVSVWLLRAPTGQPLDVLFIDAKDLGVKAGRVLQTLSSQTSNRIVQTLDRWRHGEMVDEIGFARAVSVPGLRAAEYKLLPAIHITPHRPVQDLPAHRRQITTLLRRASRLTQQIRSADSDTQRLTALIDSVSGSSHARPVSLGELCALQAGPGGSRLHNRLEPAAQVPVVLARHLRNGRILDRPDTGVSEGTARTLAAYCLKTDDLLISRTAERERVARVFAAQEGWLMSTGIIRLRVVDDRVLPAYLTHVLSAEECHAWMLRNMAGTVVPAITLSALTKLPIALPSLDAQALVSTALEGIAEQARTCAELLAVTRSLQQTLAGSLLPAPGASAVGGQDLN